MWGEFAPLIVYGFIMPKDNTYIQGEVNDQFGITECATETRRNYGVDIVYGVEFSMSDLERFYTDPTFEIELRAQVNEFRDWIMMHSEINIDPDSYDIILAVNGDIERENGYIVIKDDNSNYSDSE